MTQDVTEKRALEERLVVASRLAALGTLVAGVAHEIDNPLTGELAGQGFAIEEVEAVKEAIRSGGPVDRETHRSPARRGHALPAICHSIVTAHGGTITATSSPGQGSTFRVELPVAGDPD